MRLYTYFFSFFIVCVVLSMDIRHIGLVGYFFKKLSDKLMLCFQEQESFFHVMLRNYQFMYTAFNWLIG